jgi:hypothetical protein
MNGRNLSSDATLTETDRQIYRRIMKQALFKIMQSNDICTGSLTLQLGIGRPTIEVTQNQ